MLHTKQLFFVIITLLKEKTLQNASGENLKFVDVAISMSLIIYGAILIRKQPQGRITS